MDRPAIAVACLFAAAAAALAGQPTPAEAVAALRGRDASYEDWTPILEIGTAAAPELGKLLTGPDPRLRAQAAVLLYRLGDARALDAMAALLASPDDDARKEAAEGLLAFVGEPMAFRPLAPEAERAAALAAWKAWWKGNRDKALAQPPMKALFGKVVATDAKAQLVAVSLTGRHGLQRGATLQVRRGAEFVCRLEVVAAPADGGVGRIVELSARTAPRPGDRVSTIVH